MSCSLRSSLLLVVLLAGFAPEGWGQSSSPYHGPTRLRVTAPDHGLRNEIGRGQVIGGHTLLLVHGATSTQLPLAAVERLEVSAGNEWNWSRAALGVGAGMAAGLVLGATADCSGGLFSREGCIAAGTLMLGIPLGAVVALFAGFEEVWLPAISGLSLRATPAEGRRR